MASKRRINTIWAGGALVLALVAAGANGCGGSDSSDGTGGMGGTGGLRLGGAGGKGGSTGGAGGQGTPAPLIKFDFDTAGDLANWAFNTWQGPTDLNLAVPPSEGGAGGVGGAGAGGVGGSPGQAGAGGNAGRAGAGGNAGRAGAGGNAGRAGAGGTAGHGGAGGAAGSAGGTSGAVSSGGAGGQTGGAPRSTVLPTLSWIGTEGDPSPGALKVTVTFSDFNQLVDVITNIPATDLTGRTLKARVRLLSGTFPIGGVLFHVSAGSDYVWAGSDWTPASTFGLGEWIEIPLDLTTVTPPSGQTFDPTDVIQIGVQIMTGASYATTDTFGSAVFLIDTIEG